MPLVLTVVTFAVYWPSLRGGFLWDDDTLILDNPLVQSANGLFRIWFTTQSIDYWPLTYSSFWLEWHVFGTNPMGYHVVSVLLHLASAFLVWAILKRLAIPGAFLAALLFAVHPVNVESVAWVSQRKNTLSMVWLLLSVLWYLRAEIEHSPRRWYWLSLAAFTLAMLAKGSVASLPILLLILVWWQRRALVLRDLWRTAPFFGVATVLTLVNIWFQTHGSGEAIRHATAVERVLGAAAGVWFYLGKAVWPIHLTFVYPQWTISTASLTWWAPLAALAIVTTALMWWREKPLVRHVLAAWLFYIAALVPALGLTDVYYMKYSLVADRYQYVAILAVCTIAAAGVERLSNRLSDLRERPMPDARRRV